ncbi:MAG: acetate/propionate family kinase [Minisyncoccia bacterium]
MKKYLIVNTGSASKKYALYEGDKRLFFSHFETENGGYILTNFYGDSIEKKNITQDSFNDSLNFVLGELVNHKRISDYSDVMAIGVRVVAPGNYFLEHRLLDEKYLSELQIAKEKAPLHLTSILIEIEKIKKMFPSTVLYGISDSAFYKDLPTVAKTYGISTDIAEKYGIYRFGYHGLSLQSLVSKIPKVFGRLPSKTVVCHIGGGVSLVAIKDGQVVDTSMGFTPLEGLLMATRVGDIDSGAILYLQEKTGMSILEVRKYLNSECGLLGVSEKSADVRDLIDLEKQGDKLATLALNLYSYKIKKYIGAYTAAMNGLNGIVFSGTIGERSFIMRERILRDLECFGVKLNLDKNDLAIAEDKVISSWLSKVKVMVVPTDEMKQLAVETLNLAKD